MADGGIGSTAGSGPVRRLGGLPPSPYEERYGFSRVVTAGPFVMVGGTTSIDDLGFVVGLTPYEQTVEVLRKIGIELARDEVGLGFDDVVSVRVWVTDISRADEVGRGFFELLGSVRPLMTMMEVSSLIDPRMLVEIEVTAYRGDVGGVAGATRA